LPVPIQPSEKEKAGEATPRLFLVRLTRVSPGTILRLLPDKDIMARLLAASILFALALFTASPSRACSMIPDTISPGNYELVQIADAIVVASAGPPYGTRDEGGVVFRVARVLKGGPPEQLRLEDAGLGRVGRSDLVDLSEPHPQSSAGACNRYLFERGGNYLLFLQHGPDGQWRQLGYAYSRINEDYAGENNPWMRTVRRYLRLQQTLAPMAQMDALRHMVRSGRDDRGRRLGRTETADIERYLASVTPWKPTELLLDLYGRLDRGEPLPAPFVSTDPPLDRLFILRCLVEGDHPGAAPLFERLMNAAATTGRTRGLVLRYLARHGRYPDAYRWIETRLLDELPTLSGEEAIGLIRDVAIVQQTQSWDGEGAHWQSDAHAAATWPDLARRIRDYENRRFGEDHAIPLNLW